MACSYQGSRIRTRRRAPPCALIVCTRIMCSAGLVSVALAAKS
jgi:hypothetical protein